MQTQHKQRGMNLVELVLAIVLLSFGAVSLVAVIMQANQPQFNPLLQQQSLFIAEALLAEILSKPTHDPDNVEQGLNALEAGESQRRDYDDIQDYSNLSDTTVRDHAGHAIAELASYRVIVSLTPAMLGSNNNPMWRVSVNVAQVGNPMNTIRLTAYRSSQ